MAIFWMTEVIPLAMAAMLPAILFPAFGIMTSSEVSFPTCRPGAKQAEAPLIRKLFPGGEGVLQRLPLPAGGGHLPRHLHRQVGSSPQSGPEAGDLGGSQSCVVSPHTGQPERSFLLPTAPS